MFQKKEKNPQSLYFQCANSASLKERVIKGIRLRDKSISGEEDQLRPLVKLVGNMHGNEPTGSFFDYK